MSLPVGNFVGKFIGKNKPVCFPHLSPSPEGGGKVGNGCREIPNELQLGKERRETKFICGACLTLSAPCGRRLRRVNALRTWVCSGCAK